MAVQLGRPVDRAHCRHLSSLAGPVSCSVLFFFFQAEDGIRDWSVTGVQTCALPISLTRFWNAAPREEPGKCLIPRLRSLTQGISSHFGLTQGGRKWHNFPLGARIFGHLARGGAVWQLVGLITRRSQVQILPPQPSLPLLHGKGQPSLFNKLQPIEVGAVWCELYSLQRRMKRQATNSAHFGSK